MVQVRVQAVATTRTSSSYGCPKPERPSTAQICATQTQICSSDKHRARSLNVLVGASNLHNIHIPRDPSVKCPPDPIPIDWVTACGATSPQLELMQVKTRADIVTSVVHFKHVFDYQSKEHPGKEQQ